MKILKKILLGIIFFMPLNIFGQQLIDSICDCFNTYAEEIGIDYISTMRQAEEMLVDFGILKSKDRMGYIGAFSLLLDDNNNSSKELKEIYDSLFLSKGINLYDFGMAIDHICFALKLDTIGSNCNSITFQEFIFMKYTYIPINDEETLDYLLYFTDFDVELLRLNVTYIFLWNLYYKYGEEE